jgi:hypothetical protein
MATLDGVYGKIERARVHQGDLAQRLRHVLGPDHQQFVLDHKPDPESGRYALRVFGVPAVDPVWLTIIGDCLFNLRSALDHLAYQLVRLDNKTPTDSTYFRIRDSPFINKGKRLPMQLEPPVSRPDILKAVEAVQPYADTGDPPDPPVLNPLWALHRLNIIDKHRLLVAVVFALNLNATYWGWSGDDPAPTFYFHPVSVREDGTTVASFDFHGREPPDDFRPNAEMHVVVNEPELPNLTLDGVENLLDKLIFHVEYILTVHFGPLFPPGTERPVGRIRPVRPISP